MNDSLNQLYLILVFTLSGFLIGILFDIFRILRKSFKTSDFVTYIEDFLFWILTGLYLLYIILKFSFGNIRIFMFLCLIIGFLIYIFTISKYFISINVKIIKFFKNIFYKIFNIIIWPLKMILKFLRKIIFKPVTFITINFVSKLRNLSINSIFCKKNQKKTSQKKDFGV